MQLAYRGTQELRKSPGSPPPLVLLHAFPVDSRMWREQLSAFAPHMDVIAPDFRGYGRTPAGLEPYSMPLFAQDVVETLEGTFPRPMRAIFAGCSMGGYVMFELWRRRPELVAGLIFCDTRADADSEETRGKRRDQIEKIQSDGPEFLPKLMAQNVLSPSTREQQPELVREVRSWMSEPAPEVLTRTLEALGDRVDSTPTLPTISVPTLVIVGEEDTVTPLPCAELVSNHVSKSELVQIAHAGHLSPLENPTAVNRAVHGWLSRYFSLPSG